MPRGCASPAGESLQVPGGPAAIFWTVSEKISHLLICRLVKILVPSIHRDKRVGGTLTNHFVRDECQSVARIARPDGYRHDDARRLLQADRYHGGL